MKLVWLRLDSIHQKKHSNVWEIPRERI